MPSDMRPDDQKKEDKVEYLYKYPKSNTRDTIAYVILLVGLILLFSESSYGGILVGLVGGLYFYREIMDAWNTYTRAADRAKSIIAGGLFIAFFIMAPAIYIGALIAIAIRVFIKQDTL